MEGLIRLRRCILQTLYDLFKKHPYAQVELAQLLETCQTDIETLNWNMVYLEKAGFVELSKAFDMPPFIACSVSIAVAGIDLIENEDEFDNRFSDKEFYMDKIQKAADFLVDLRKNTRTVDTIPAEFCPESLEQAYEIQNALTKGLLSHFGGEQIGYKIACTNKLAQELLNVEAPFFGRLLSSSTYSSPARLKANTFTHRLIEPEFAFELDADVPASSMPYTKDSIAAFVRSLLPAIELVDWRYTDWTTVGVESLVADNAVHGAWIRGKRHKNWREFDLSVHDVQLFVNGSVTEKGSGAAVLGHPLNALAWLANELPKHHGLSLKAGDLVTTGVATNVYFAETDDIIQADFGALGTVDLEWV